ncbi:hypothetical protein CROQUDRAFT_98925 [Cronartium quercuum f. sp. fusiforme G11]|uniref:Uncharacterized protein n=1 Tax=Cronartium quercuum f. sp. fusiforme G11 TaxID=708437 RepID=A0A9P6N7G5_9BASI|nr:hypothetical protein CROQUDRAFT_98925 [Cronartium quercuum f. sp. fusiforme G11]
MTSNRALERLTGGASGGQSFTYFRQRPGTMMGLPGGWLIKLNDARGSPFTIHVDLFSRESEQTKALTRQITFMWTRAILRFLIGSSLMQATLFLGAGLLVCEELENRTYEVMRLRPGFIDLYLYHQTARSPPHSHREPGAPPSPLLYRKVKKLSLDQKLIRSPTSVSKPNKKLERNLHGLARAIVT